MKMLGIVAFTLLFQFDGAKKNRHRHRHRHRNALGEIKG